MGYALAMNCGTVRKEGGWDLGVTINQVGKQNVLGINDLKPLVPLECEMWY
jgi:hypothetical protein